MSEGLKFTFKTLDYQSDAVQAIIDVFKGQINSGEMRYKRDIGSEESHQTRIDEDTGIPKEDYSTGYRNNDVTISKDQLLSNIREVQAREHLTPSTDITDPLGFVTLDIEMETGTGKTYVYTKAMYELHEKYGWNKFIIVVPTVAIREGVLKSIQTTESHFMSQYHGKKIRAFIYDSDNLTKIDDYSRDPGINVMIINSQAFAREFNDKGDESKKGLLKIFQRRDDFNGRMPIEVIAANRPILILDEPQKLGQSDVSKKNTSKTQLALKNHFKPLFSMNFSATHGVHHNEIYSLDSLDAFNNKLVKKIKVKGVEIKHDTGDRYIYLENVFPTPSGRRARMEILVGHSNGIKKETHIFSEKDDLHKTSNGLEYYKELYIVSIDCYNNSVTFNDGSVLYAGQCIGEKGKDEAKRRIQIRETIVSHLTQEEKLFKKGIKVLSLFFIDEVSNYRVYDGSGEYELGIYGKIFEDEFNRIIAERGSLFDKEYIDHLTSTDVRSIHNGYFSKDKKGNMINSKLGRGEDSSSDIDAYDLILKNKELLLSYDSPVRFIFSHSALSEGWDNPNVFQICTLKHSDSTTRRRQEVGRGMRICVNQKGERQDSEVLGPLFHDINSLTVIADESYEAFVKGLQSEELEDIRARPTPLNEATLTGQFIVCEYGEVSIESGQAKILYKYLSRHEYIDDYTDLPTQALKDALTFKNLEELPEPLRPYKDGIIEMLTRLSQPRTIASTIKNARKPVIKVSELNDNFYRKEFIKLWNEINHKYHYSVSFDSQELIDHSVKSIEDHLVVTRMSYVVTTGEQKSQASYSDAINKDRFERASSTTDIMDVVPNSDVKYDLIGRITEKTGLTRKTVASILTSLQQKTFDLFRDNPEEFIEKVSGLINDEKATVIVDHIEYNLSDGVFDNNIFTIERPEGDYDTAYQAKKNVQDYIFPQSDVELKFARALDESQQVAVYAKLPDGKNGFSIPTPMDNYAPDWAIAFEEGSVRHIFFVAETKGSMRSLDLRPIEASRIKCAEKLFKAMHKDVIFHEVTSYDDLWSLVTRE